MVPVHALVEVPRDLVYEDTLLMEMWANPHFFRALIDDDFSMPETAVNTSAPGQGLDVNTINVFNDPATDIITFNGAKFARPDEIWSQCGIQFRLTGVSVIYSDTEALKLAQEGNGALHSLEERVSGGRPLETDDIRLLWGNPPAKEVALLAFVWDVSGESKGLQYGMVAAVAISKLRTADISVASHELGHYLGVNGTDGQHVQCPGDTHLMCKNNGWSNVIAGCDSWRDGEAARGEPEICLPGSECPPPVIDPPVGCDLDELVPGNVCEIARKNAGLKAVRLTKNTAPKIT